MAQHGTGTVAVPRRAWRAALAAALCSATLVAHAAALQFCSQEPSLTPAQQDRLLRFGAVVKEVLEAAGQPAALIARSGTNLDRFGVRYSHAGITLQHSPNTPWSVRQLYYACDERKPRLFDQGMSGFVLGGSDPALGYVSLLLLPPAHTAALEQAALDNRQVLQLLGATYSANAYPFSPLYQNCNQWVAELLATLWSTASPAGEVEPVRERAQRWLQQTGFEPTVFATRNPFLMLATGFAPLLHSNDHPPEDVKAMRYRVATPQAIEHWVQQQIPGARRIELCHNTTHVVVRRGPGLLPEGCRPETGDTVVLL